MAKNKKSEKSKAPKLSKKEQAALDKAQAKSAEAGKGKKARKVVETPVNLLDAGGEVLEVTSTPTKGKKSKKAELDTTGVVEELVAAPAKKGKGKKSEPEPEPVEEIVDETPKGKKGGKGKGSKKSGGKEDSSPTPEVTAEAPTPRGRPAGGKPKYTDIVEELQAKADDKGKAQRYKLPQQYKVAGYGATTIAEKIRVYNPELNVTATEKLDDTPAVDGGRGWYDVTLVVKPSA